MRTRVVDSVRHPVVMWPHITVLCFGDELDLAGAGARAGEVRARLLADGDISVADAVLGLPTSLLPAVAMSKRRGRVRSAVAVASRRELTIDPGAGDAVVVVRGDRFWKRPHDLATTVTPALTHRTIVGMDPVSHVLHDLAVAGEMRRRCTSTHPFRLVETVREFGADVVAVAESRGPDGRVRSYRARVRTAGLFAPRSLVTLGSAASSGYGLLAPGV